MRHDPDGDYRWISHLMDHFTKFHVLFPIVDKSAHCVAENLRERVFAYFGLPFIVQSDNRREFAKRLSEQLVEIWPG